MRYLNLHNNPIPIMKIVNPPMDCCLFSGQVNSPDPTKIEVQWDALKLLSLYSNMSIL